MMSIMLTDHERFEQLITARHACVSIVTSEEGYALSIVGDTAMKRQCDYWLWSVTRGVRDGMLADAPPVPDTDHPAAALFHLSRNLKKRALIVALDVIGHLKDERVARALRDALVAVMQTNSTLVLIDYRDDLPPLVQAIIAALFAAFREKIQLNTQHILHALKISPPLSGTMREKINWLRTWAKGRCVPAD